MECIGISTAVEVPVSFAPVPPAGSQTANDLFGGTLGSGGCVGIDGAVSLVSRNAGFAEVFADHDVGRQLAPGLRHFGVVHLKHHRTIGVVDATGSLGPLDGGEDVGPGLGESSGDPHGSVFLLWPAGQPSHPTLCRPRTHGGACPLIERCITKRSTAVPTPN